MQTTHPSDLSKDEADLLSKNIQNHFNQTYISSSEIAALLGVNRSSIVYARKTGALPKPITIRGTRAFIWERKMVAPYLDAWKLQLQRHTPHMRSKARRNSVS